MARKVGPPDADAMEATADGYIAITKSKLKSLLGKLRTAQGRMDEERSSMGGMVADAVEHANAHKGSLGWIRRLTRMDDVKRKEWLWHFDRQREHMEWTEADLFASAKAGEPGKPRLVAAE